MMEAKAYLVLENGMVFEGKRFGAAGEVIGELVFTTAMTGYLETLTDPSFYGQIVMQTFPLIGNYGVIPSDFESSAPALKAYIVRDWCQAPSNFRCEGELDTFLKAHGIVGLYGLDTRAITKLVREAGVMNALITDTAAASEEMLERLRRFKITDAVKTVSHRDKAVRLTPEGPVRHRVVLWDFGAKRGIARQLVHRGCEVTMVPSDTTAAQILSLRPDGLMLSNGPGDPAENTGVIEELKALMKARIPTFGICLGHQLLALSQGGRTQKLKYGHRGANQPVMNIDTGRVYITSQNHGYTVVTESLPDGAIANYRNANDGTCEGIRYANMPAFSVQFHPEAAAGPEDTAFLFDQFIDSLKKGC